MTAARLERDRYLARVEAFSDGVFAFAATLLVLGIRIPRPGDADASAGLQRLLADQWPSYVAFALSFVAIAGYALIAIFYLIPTPRLFGLAQRNRTKRQ